MTKLGPKRIHTVRVRGGNLKYRALRLEAGTFSWASESISRKTRVIDVVYNASNNELVRTKTIVKGCVVQIDATPFRQWFEAHYGVPLGRKKTGGKKEVRWRAGPPPLRAPAWYGTVSLIRAAAVGHPPYAWVAPRAGGGEGR